MSKQWLSELEVVDDLLAMEPTYRHNVCDTGEHIVVNALRPDQRPVRGFLEDDAKLESQFSDSEDELESIKRGPNLRNIAEMLQAVNIYEDIKPHSVHVSPRRKFIDNVIKIKRTDSSSVMKRLDSPSIKRTDSPNVNQIKTTDNTNEIQKPEIPNVTNQSNFSNIIKTSDSTMSNSRLNPLVPAFVPKDSPSSSVSNTVPSWRNQSNADGSLSVNQNWRQAANAANIQQSNDNWRPNDNWRQESNGTNTEVPIDIKETSKPTIISSNETNIHFNQVGSVESVRTVRKESPASNTSINASTTTTIIKKPIEIQPVSTTNRKKPSRNVVITNLLNKLAEQGEKTKTIKPEEKVVTVKDTIIENKNENKIVNIKEIDNEREKDNYENKITDIEKENKITDIEKENKITDIEKENKTVNFGKENENIDNEINRKNNFEEQETTRKVTIGIKVNDWLHKSEEPVVKKAPPISNLDFAFGFKQKPKVERNLFENKNINKQETPSITLIGKYQPSKNFEKIKQKIAAANEAVKKSKDEHWLVAKVQEELERKAKLREMKFSDTEPSSSQDSGQTSRGSLTPEN